MPAKPDSPEPASPEPTTDFQVVPLGACPSTAEQLATWHYAQWGWMNPHNTVRARVERFQQHMTPGIPTTFVALIDGKPVGSASLADEDMTTRPELSPWLVSVFVAPHARRMGIGGALVDRVVQEAARLEIPTLYLFTPDQMRLYASLGWRELEQVDYHGEVDTIMSIRPAERMAAKR